MKNFFLILLMILIVAGTGYGVYYQIDNHNKKNETSSETINQTNETQEEVGESIDINSSIVKQLYSYVNIDNWVDILANNNGKIEAIYFNNEFKSYLGYRQIPNSEIKSSSCSQYPSVTSTRICGNANDAQEGPNGTYDSTNSITNVISESVLKENVEKIFGDNSYVHVENFGISNCTLDHTNDYTGYQFDSSSNMYVYYSGMAGCAQVIPTKEMVSVESENDVIEIIENQKVEQNENNSIPTQFLYNKNIKYTFKKVNGNYYFDSVELVK